MDKNLPTYLIDFDPETFESGIDLIAVTETPAIETLSLRFSEVAKMIFSFNEDKQLIVGPAIIPDKPIYRVENGKEFYVVFTKETIEKMVEKFNSELRSIKFNIEHDENFLVEGFIKESWIVENCDVDKSKLYGFSVPVGTWMISAKITDKEVWNNVIKQMDKVGFSIEGLMGIQPTQFSKGIHNSNSETTDTTQNKSNKMKKTNKKSRFFATKINTKRKFNKSSKKFEDVLISEEEEVLIAEEIAEGAPVEMLDDNGEIVAAEDGTYVIESEEVQVEVAEGAIVAVEEVVVEEPAAEEEKAMKKKMEEDKEEDKEGKKEDEKEKMEVDAETLAKIVELENRLEALEAKLAEGEAPAEFKTKFSKDAAKAKRLSTLRNLVK